jgi:hypothetical protein
MTDKVDAVDIDEPFAGDEPKSSRAILAALKKAEDAFREWQNVCQDVDDLYNLNEYRTDLTSLGWQDADLDLFWSSFEVLKPAVYARPPQPVVAPLFKDGKALHNLTAELLERCAISTFQRTGINDVMLLLRDDLIFTGRGSPWVRHEVDDGKHSVCVEHKDRLDFLHEPARKWSEVGWVAGAAWMTKADMRKRFRKTSGDRYQDASYSVQRDDDGRDLEKRASVRKAKVWEVWHKADKKVYWVTEGVDVMLDSSTPELTLTDFFPCPKPAYATLRRRSLIPVPDFQRYSIHFKKISELTRRIYALLDKVQMKGLIPAGGDVGQAIEDLIRDDSDQILIPVPGGAMMAQGATGFVAWLPLNELAQAIQGLIDARTQLINDFYSLSGISDIMRGATEAEETLGAQQLKSQYGSVRVREKSAELQRVAADTVKIAAEIIADKFPQKALLEMSGLDIPSKADIEKRVSQIETEAKKDLEGLNQKAREQAQQAQQQQGGEQQAVDPQQAQQMLQQAQQQVLAKYAPMLADAEQQVPIEDVMKLLRDDRAMSFVFEIESSSTILTDELQEKSTRNEFMTQFTSASQPLMGMAAMGDAGAKLAGELMKFVLAPYRAGRTLDGAIDEFIDAAPEMAKAAAGNQGDTEGLAEANKTLAEAEKVKAQAAMASVEARAAQAQADNERKITELQQKGAIETDKHQRESEKLSQQMAKQQGDAAQAQQLLEAQIDKLRADTYAILIKAGVAEDQQALNEFKSVADVRARSQDQQTAIEHRDRDDEFRERGESRADRSQEFTETTAMQESGNAS